MATIDCRLIPCQLISVTVVIVVSKLDILFVIFMDKSVINLLALMLIKIKLLKLNYIFHLYEFSMKEN